MRPNEYPPTGSSQSQPRLRRRWRYFAGDAGEKMFAGPSWQ